MCDDILILAFGQLIYHTGQGTVRSLHEGCLGLRESGRWGDDFYKTERVWFGERDIYIVHRICSSFHNG